MKLTPILFTQDMQASMDFYISHGFEARDVMQEGDEIQSMKLVYKDNEDVALLFRLGSEKPAGIILQIDESANDIEWHQKERYSEPENKEIQDPNGYKLVFTKMS